MVLALEITAPVGTAQDAMAAVRKAYDVPLRLIANQTGAYPVRCHLSLPEDYNGRDMRRRAVRRVGEGWTYGPMQRTPCFHATAAFVTRLLRMDPSARVRVVGAEANVLLEYFNLDAGLKRLAQAPVQNWAVSYYCSVSVPFALACGCGEDIREMFDADPELGCYYLPDQREGVFRRRVGTTPRDCNDAPIFVGSVVTTDTGMDPEDYASGDYALYDVVGFRGGEVVVEDRGDGERYEYPTCDVEVVHV